LRLAELPDTSALLALEILHVEGVEAYSESRILRESTSKDLEDLELKLEESETDQRSHHCGSIGLSTL
jgi:hypothetical protein